MLIKKVDATAAGVTSRDEFEGAEKLSANIIHIYRNEKKVPAQHCTARFLYKNPTPTL